MSSTNLTQIINKSIFDDKNVNEFKHNFSTAKPFPVIRIESFLNDDFLSKLETSIDKNISFEKKDNDLYKFYQSYSLQDLPQNTPIQDLIKSLYSQNFIDLLFKITGKHLSSNPDLFASCYTDSDYLLCHDDQIEDRRIAFLLYLVPNNWNKSDGGALNIYDSYNTQNTANTQNSNSSNIMSLFPCNEPVKQLIPLRNSVVLFQVSNKSFHAVDEVLSSNKSRIAIGGWWHDQQLMNNNNQVQQIKYNTVAAADPVIQWTDCIQCKLQTSLIKKWLNPIYLKDESIKQLRQKFMQESHLMLCNFIKDELYYKLLKQLFAVKYKTDNNNNNDDGELCWTVKGPIHRRLYYILNNVNDISNGDDDISLILEFNQLINSFEWKLFVENISSLKLLKYNIEMRRFNHGNYTLAHDLDRFKDLPGLDVNYQFIENEENGWDIGNGGSIYYTLSQKVNDNNNDMDNGSKQNVDDDDNDDDLKSNQSDNNDNDDDRNDNDKDDDDDDDDDDMESMDDNILMAIHCFPNTLSITYRSECGVMNFVKYINHNASSSKIDFNQVWTVDDNDDDDDEDDDIKVDNDDKNDHDVKSNKKRKLSVQDALASIDNEPPNKKQKV